MATTAYVSLSNALEKKPGEAGGMVAVNIADGKTALDASADGRHLQRAAGMQHRSAGSGVVDSRRGASQAASTDTCAPTTARPGKVLWDVNTVNEYDTVNRIPARGGSMNGPGATIVGGMLFVNSGYGSLGFMPGNVVLAFSIDGK